MTEATIQSGSIPANRKTLPRAATWLPLVIAALAVCLVAAFGFYGLKFFRSSAFDDERAFRALSEIIGQFDNLQETMGSLLQLVPANANKPGEAERYTRSLTLEGLGLDVRHGDSKVCPPSPQRAIFEVQMTGSARDFLVRQCLMQERAEVEYLPQRARYLELSGDLNRHLQAFVVQEFFDEVVIATQDGVAVAQVHGRSRDEARIEIHDARADGLVIADPRGLMQRASQGETAGKPEPRDKQQASATFPFHPVVFNDEIAGDAYRVFVQPFAPRYPLLIKENSTASTQPLYLIGVKRQNVLQSISAALGPTGTLAITLLVLLTILGWPLLSLKFASAQDPLSAAQAFAVVIALLLIPAVVTVAGFSNWSRQHLTLWADDAAETYARQVESGVLRELSDATLILDHLAQQFAGDPEITASRFEMPAKHGLCLPPATCDKPFAALPLPPAWLPGWLPIHIASPLNLAGRSAGLFLDLGRGTFQDLRLNLGDREYFKALMASQEWRPASLWEDPKWQSLGLHTPAHGFVAQRLFNRTDGARVLQVAVPIDSNGQRQGIVTGDSRAYRLTASIRPPLLRFAIVDSSNGAVLFHSNDKRSLAENLLVETQQNGSLQSALRNRTSSRTLDRISSQDHFSGDYMGEAYRFYYRPVSGVPWGIVVFYSEQSLGVAVVQTAIATLATYFACVACIIVLATAVIVVVPGRPDLELLKCLWPRWELRRHYGVFSGYLMTALAMTLAFVVCRVNDAQNGTAWLAVSVTALVLLLVERRRRRSASNLQRYQNEFVRCMVCVVSVAAVVPTAWFAIDYYDTSVKALVRDELRRAADDVDHRYRVMTRDLRQWAGDQDAIVLGPSARELVEQLPVPGFAPACSLYAGPPERNDKDGMTWAVTAFTTRPWLTSAGPPTLDLFRRTIWTLSTDRHLQRAWASTEQRNSADAGTDACGGGSRSGVSYWLRSEDGYRIKMALPLNAARRDSILIRDEELATLHYGWSGNLNFAAATLSILLLLALLSWHTARRLFGIRLPFAARFTHEQPDRLDLAPVINCELDLLDFKKALLKADPNASFTTKDENDWRAVHCRSMYQSMWKSLQTDEQLLLHQLAKGKFANPENQAVIEHLLQRGYLKLRPWPLIAEAGFANYVRTAETERQFADWQTEASRNLWNRIRIPLLVIVVVVTASLMWLAGSTMQILSATLAGVATLFGYVTQVTNFVRKDSKPMGS